MCEKQCRDENGFKCHAQSEAHLRNMQLYGQNPKQFKEKVKEGEGDERAQQLCPNFGLQFSLEFEHSFLKELSRRHHTNTVKANTYYAEYISDRDHLHMNATKWNSLTDFIKDLGRRGLVRVEEQEQGWFITYIDRTPGAAETESEKQVRKEKTVLDDADRDRRRAEAQLRAAKDMGLTAAEVKSSALERGEDAAPVTFAFVAPAPVAAPKRDVAIAFRDDDEGDDGKQDKVRCRLHYV
jgi:DNA/RNA-binding protein KIN17